MDVYDISNNNYKIIKTIHTGADWLGPGQTVPRAHMSTADATGRFWATMNLGTDTIVLTDGQNDAWTIVNRVRLTPGCAPRHGAFYPPGANMSTHFMVLCETQSSIHVFKLQYQPDMISFHEVQMMSTFGQDSAANFTNSRAGEIVVSADGMDVYVSNRLTSATPTNDTMDSISQFRVSMDCDTRDLSLQFVQEVPSGGLTPRMMSLCLTDNVLFVGNQAGGKFGLIALSRATSDNGTSPIGTLGKTPLASLPSSVFGTGQLMGPEYIMQIA